MYQKKKHSMICILLGITMLCSGCGQTNRISTDEILSEDGDDEETFLEKGAMTESASDSEDLIEESSTEYTESTETDTSIPVESWEVISVLDAWNEWHEMPVNPSVTPHPYHWEQLTNDGQNVTYEDTDYIVQKGIDVSHHQGKIQWDKVKNDSIDFAILRIGYRSYGSSGSLNKDKQFENNYTGATAAGLDVGIYIFSQAITVEEALEEAEYVLELLDGRELQLPIVYDPEILHDTTARTDDVTGEQFTQNTIAFCEAIKAAGYDVMIYSNIVFEHEYFDLEQLQQYPIWYADYEPVPQSPYDFCYWQYSCEGKVLGIGGYVDLNVRFLPQN